MSKKMPYVDREVLDNLIHHLDRDLPIPPDLRRHAIRELRKIRDPAGYRHEKFKEETFKRCFSIMQYRAQGMKAGDAIDAVADDLKVSSETVKRDWKKNGKKYREWLRDVPAGFETNTPLSAAQAYFRAKKG